MENQIEKNTTENKLDILIEDMETVSNEITKMNFEMDGFKEEADRLIEKQPYMVRQIQQNEKRMYRMITQLTKHMEKKHKLDAELNKERALYQAAHPEKYKKPAKKSTKKTLSKKVSDITKEVGHDKND